MERDKKMREIFLPQFLLMAVTVYNPVFPVALNSFFDVNKEYYRFLWMSPVIICIAAAGTILVSDCTCREQMRDLGDDILKGTVCGDNETGEKNPAAFTGAGSADKTVIKEGISQGSLHNSKSIVRISLASVFLSAC